MRRTILLFTLLTVLTVAAFSEVHDSSVFYPVTPEVLGQGGSFTAVSRGYNALFTNPAGFARDGGSFTLLSATATPYFIPSEGQIESLSSIVENPNRIEDSIGILSDIITSNGIGSGISAGFGIVGKGLGLGLVANVDFYGKGVTALGTKVDVAYTLAGIAGYAVPLDLGFMQLAIGGDVRYMLKKEMQDISLLTLLDDNQSGTFDVLYGSGLAIDAGLIAELGPLSAGFSVRDIGGTAYDYSGATIPSENLDLFFNPMTGDLEQELYSANLIADGDQYVTPMTLSYGLAFHPDLGFLRWLIDPTLHVEYRDTFYDDSDPSFWTKVHAGTEIKVLRFMKVRAGINQGYLTAGFGAKILFLDVNAAFFTREMGTLAGANPNQGFSLEAAIRF